MGARIKWNFTKFLVDKEGRVIQRYGPTTPPMSFEVLFLPFSFFGLVEMAWFESVLNLRHIL